MAEKEKIIDILWVRNPNTGVIKYYSGRTGAEFRNIPVYEVDGVMFPKNKGHSYNPFPQSMKTIELIRAARRSARGGEYWESTNTKGNTIYVNKRGGPIKAVDGYADRGKMTPAELSALRAAYRAGDAKKYRDTFKEEIPLKAMPFPIAHTTDAVLKAVNKTVATSMGIPLNKLNKPVVNAIYAKEIGDAAREAPELFQSAMGKGAFKSVVQPRGLKHFPHIIANPGSLNKYYNRMRRVNLPELETYGLSIPDNFSQYTKGWAKEQIAAHSGVIGLTTRKLKKDGTPRKPRKDKGLIKGTNIRKPNVPNLHTYRPPNYYEQRAAAHTGKLRNLASARAKAISTGLPYGSFYVGVPDLMNKQ